MQQKSHKNPAAASTEHDQSHSRPQTAMTSTYGEHKENNTARQPRQSEDNSPLLYKTGEPMLNRQGQPLPTHAEFRTMLENRPKPTPQVYDDTERNKARAARGAPPIERDETGRRIRRDLPPESDDD